MLTVSVASKFSRFSSKQNTTCCFSSSLRSHRRFSTQSQNNQNSGNVYTIGRKPNESLDVYRKRLMYRSKLRGMKETILLLGTFATKHLKSFDEQKMRQFEQILEEPDPDVYNWVVGTHPTPSEFENEVMLMLKEHVRANPLEGSLDDKIRSIS